MRPKLQKRSALKLVGRIIPGAQGRGKANEMNNLKVTIGSSLPFEGGGIIRSKISRSLRVGKLRLIKA